MDWILEHLQVLFVIAIAVVAMLQKLKQARSGEAPPEAPPAPPDVAERTRRIQEEIRRRILERRGLAPAGPPPEFGEEPPDFPPVPPPLLAELRPSVDAAAPLAPADGVMTDPRVAELERQQQLIGQFRELEASRQASTVRGPGPMTGGTGTFPNRLLPDLRSPAGLRRAVILREILGPPVGLR